MKNLQELYSNLSEQDKKELRIQADLLTKIWDKIGIKHFLTASEVLKTVYGDNIKLPIDPRDITAHFGIKVVQRSNMEVRGLSQFDGNNIEIHYKPTYNNGNRDRFTIAHELGHIFLHFLEGQKFEFKDEFLKDGFNDLGEISQSISPIMFRAARKDDDLNTDILENEANIFAGELLVPQKEIGVLKNRLEKGERYRSSDLCRYFQVSNGTMFYVMKNYNEWDSMVADDYFWQ